MKVISDLCRMWKKDASGKVVLIAGALSLLFLLLSFGNGKWNVKHENTVENDKEKASFTIDENEKYKKQLEEELVSVLQSMDGIGEVKVMITIDASAEITGVVVVAQGADNHVMIGEITDAVLALFSVEAHKVKVLNMKS